MNNVMLEQGIRPTSVDMEIPELLRQLIKERFPGQTVVTASLMASSIVVLKMVSEIDNTTPIIFCRRPPFFEESTKYRAKIVESLGLQNVSMTDGREVQVGSGDKDHCEYMWLQYRSPGRSFETLHLNDCLARYNCWISAVYHDSRPNRVRNLIAPEGKLMRVDPLVHWSKGDVREFMSAHGLPYHEMAKRNYRRDRTKEGTTHPTYHY